MSLLRSLAREPRSLFRKERVEGELDEELRGFLEMATEEKVKQGVSPKEAQRAVRLEQGTVEIPREVIRSAGWESFLETLWKDLRYAVRLLGRSPVFTIVAILSLTLGIGANTAIFQLIDAVRLRTLPVKEPSRLVGSRLVRPLGICRRHAVAGFAVCTPYAVQESRFHCCRDCDPNTRHRRQHSSFHDRE